MARLKLTSNNSGFKHSFFFNNGLNLLFSNVISFNSLIYVDETQNKAPDRSMVKAIYPIFLVIPCTQCAIMTIGISSRHSIYTGKVDYGVSVLLEQGTNYLT